MNDTAIVGILAVSALLLTQVVYMWLLRNQQRTIDSQNDTIQRLINREPVTYQEVGAKPPKAAKEVYAAWGAQMVNIDEDESRS